MDDGGKIQSAESERSRISFRLPATWFEKQWNRLQATEHGLRTEVHLLGNQSFYLGSGVTLIPNHP